MIDSSPALRWGNSSRETRQCEVSSLKPVPRHRNARKAADRIPHPPRRPATSERRCNPQTYAARGL